MTAVSQKFVNLTLQKSTLDTEDQTVLGVTRDNIIQHSRRTKIVNGRLRYS